MADIRDIRTGKEVQAEADTKVSERAKVVADLRRLADEIEKDDERFSEIRSAQLVCCFGKHFSVGAYPVGYWPGYTIASGALLRIAMLMELRSE